MIIDYGIQAPNYAPNIYYHFLCKLSNHFGTISGHLPPFGSSYKKSTNIPVLSYKDAKTKDIIAESLIKIFIDGPLVSFSGSPTVSPITAAL